MEEVYAVEESLTNHVESGVGAWDDKLAFLMIDDEAKKQLVEFAPILEENLRELLDGFYEHVTRWPNLQEMLSDGANIARLKEEQTAHWRLLFTGRFDASYVEQVRKVGLAHERIGLSPSWYIGGYRYILDRVFQLLVAHFKKKPKEMTAMFSAVSKAVFLDMDLVMTVYNEQMLESHKTSLEKLAGEFEGSVKGVVDSLSGAAMEMKSSAESMASVADQTSERSSAVATASEQTSANVQTVASAAEELSASVKEIGSQVEKSTSTASRAVDTASQANESISGLAAAGEKIGAVVSMISDIAEQTNLLALNATIEAARAGDAGKGFAVVASEVKSLANQTANATEDISAQITAMQTEINGSVDAIQTVSGIIEEISAVAAAIASAVEEQGAATQEIARNVAEAATGTKEVSRNVARLSEVASETGSTASQVRDASNELSRQGENLSIEVDRFLAAVRST